MASLFRPWYTDRATGQKKRAKKWYGQYRDAAGATRRVPLSANKDAARMMLNDLVRRVELEKGGITDHFREHRGRPLTEHLTDWETVLRARANTDEYVRMKVARARKVIDAAGFVYIADLSASKVEGALAELRKLPRFGTQTANHYLAAVKQFARWLVKDRRTSDNPLAHLEGGNVKLDRRHRRRDLTDAELVRLLDYTRTGPTRRKLTGPDREALYLASVYTGLRASELASLTPVSFALDADRPTVTVAAAYSKHRREDVIPLHPDAVARLRPWLATKPAGAPLWPGIWAKFKRGGTILKQDAEAARAAWIAEAGHDPAERRRRERSDFLATPDAEGRVIDFHGLRHTFITRLVKAGVKPKDAQALARHSTITLTMDRYAHIGLADVSDAVGMVPAIAADPAGACTPACTKLALAAVPQSPQESPGVLQAGDGTNSSEPSGTPEISANCTVSGRNGAEGKGFEPLDGASPSPVFKTGAIDHSATPPMALKQLFAVNLLFLAHHDLLLELLPGTLSNSKHPTGTQTGSRTTDYPVHCNAMPKSTRERQTRKAPGRPSKPYADLPLYPHSLGYWSKKILGKIHHFGRWGRVQKGMLTPLPYGQGERISIS